VEEEISSLSDLFYCLKEYCTVGTSSICLAVLFQLAIINALEWWSSNFCLCSSVNLLSMSSLVS
jgi:hypothetical protein